MVNRSIVTGGDVYSMQHGQKPSLEMNLSLRQEIFVS